jgi:hypothetical protein
MYPGSNPVRRACDVMACYVYVTSFEKLLHDKTASNSKRLDASVIRTDQRAKGVLHIHKLDHQLTPHAVGEYRTVVHDAAIQVVEAFEFGTKLSCSDVRDLVWRKGGVKKKGDGLLC